MSNFDKAFPVALVEMEMGLESVAERMEFEEIKTVTIFQVFPLEGGTRMKQK